MVETEDQSSDYDDAPIAALVEAELYLHPWLGHMTLFLFGAMAKTRRSQFSIGRAPDRSPLACYGLRWRTINGDR